MKPLILASGAYASKDEACLACKHAAKGSCTYYLTAKCYAANSVALDFSDMSGLDADALDADTGKPLGKAKTRGDTNDWSWTMNAENAGANYKLCSEDGRAGHDGSVDPTCAI